MQKMQQYIQTQNRGNVCSEHNKERQVSTHNECKNATIYTQRIQKCNKQTQINKNTTVRIIKKYIT